MINKAKCLICNEIIESKSLHDFQCCTCGNLCVDGGSHYIKRSVKEIDQYEELSTGYKNVGKNNLQKEIKE